MRAKSPTRPVTVTRRGRLTLVLGVTAYVGAWAFGAKALYPAAIALVLVAVLAWAVVRVSVGPMQLRRSFPPGELTEGDDARVELELRAPGALPGTSIDVAEDVTIIGPLTTRLARRGAGQYSGTYVLRGLRRGRYSFGRARAIVEDPFALERAEVPLAAADALLVYPRLAVVERLFSETGASAVEGRRLLLRRPSGFDLHSVREYEQGESLRRVHWPSSAKRGELMVKELEDAPRDEVAILLDAHAFAVSERVRRPVFDLQVRAAASLISARTRCGQAATLIVTSAVEEAVRVESERDWRAALDVLAGVEPTGLRPAAAALADQSARASRALDLTVVTASASDELVERLLQRALARRPAALVYVDAGSFARPARAQRAGQRALVRLAAAGVPVAVARERDDLAAVLSADHWRQAARA